MAISSQRRFYRPLKINQLARGTAECRIQESLPRQQAAYALGGVLEARSAAEAYQRHTQYSHAARHPCSLCCCGLFMR